MRYRSVLLKKIAYSARLIGALIGAGSHNETWPRAARSFVLDPRQELSRVSPTFASNCSFDRLSSRRRKRERERGKIAVIIDEPRDTLGAGRRTGEASSCSRGIAQRDRASHFPSESRRSFASSRHHRIVEFVTRRRTWCVIEPALTPARAFARAVECARSSEVPLAPIVV